MPAVDHFVHPSQKGFLAGKQGSDHVVDINSHFYKAVKAKENKLLFLLDTPKAFDSGFPCSCHCRLPTLVQELR